MSYYLTQMHAEQIVADRIRAAEQARLARRARAYERAAGQAATGAEPVRRPQTGFGRLLHLAF